MKTIRIVEYSPSFDWDAICFDEENEKVMQSRNDYRTQMIQKFLYFFSSFPDCQIQIGSSDTRVRDEASMHSFRGELIQKRNINRDYSPFQGSFADQMLNALQSEDVDVIWLQGGGNPKDIIDSEKRITEVINEIHKNTIGTQIERPKLLLGFCVTAPLLLYLSARSLARAVHSALPLDMNDIFANREAKEKFVDLFSHAGLNPFSLSYSGLKPLNSAAIKLMQGKLVPPPQGFVVGGLLQVIINTFIVLLYAEKRLKIDIISGKNLLLFVELLEFGNEVDKLKALKKIIKENNLQVKSLALGRAVPRHGNNEIDKEKYLKNISVEFEGMAKDFEFPVSDGLNVGHVAGQEPIPLSFAELGVEDGSLKVRYTNGATPLNFLDVNKVLLWNKNQLQDEDIRETESLSDLCCIL